MTMTDRSKASLVAVLAVLGCSTSPAGKPDGAQLPDICNSQSDAQSQSQCQLQPGKQATYYIDHLGKELWLGFTLPQQLTAQSLLTIQAGYNPQLGSPVQLAISGVSTSGAPVFARVADDHDPGPPGALNIIVPAPTTLAGQMIFLLCTDDGNSHDDPVNPFYITANVITDPDPNQAGVPTAVTFSANTSGVQESSPKPQGVISTPGRVDEYSIGVPSGVQRPVMYFSITVPSEQGDGGILSPPINYLMGYALYDCGTQTAAACAGTPPAEPTGTIVASDHMPNKLLVVNLDDALLVNAGDTYLLEVAGWHDPSSVVPVQGDTRVTYQLDVRVLPDTDPYDDPSSPFQVSNLSLNGSSVTLSGGSLNHASQIDVFSVPLSAQGKNTRIHYKFKPGTAGSGRFPPLPEYAPVRVAAFYTPVPATAGADPGANCRTDQNTCPNDTANLLANAPAGVQQDYCEADGGPYCLYSYRQEDPTDFSNLQNFEGIIPVQAGTSQVYLNYQDQGGKWADDVSYTLTLTWLDEGPENQGAYHWYETTALSGGTLTSDVPPSGNFPAPPTGATTLQGVFTLGNSLTPPNDPGPGNGKVHGTNDYDAIPSTLDVWALDIPSLPLGPTVGETWELQWQLQNGPGGQPPLSIAVTPFVCVGGTCQTPESADPFTGLNASIIYQQGQIHDWAGAPATTWSQSTTANAGFVTDTVQAEGCYCFDPGAVQNGKFYLFVQGYDRQSYDDAQYVIQTAVTTYPQALPDGGTCPVTDGGIPDGGTTPIWTSGCQMEKGEPGCGGQGASCNTNADCCSLSCNIANPTPTGGNLSGSCN